MEALAESEPDRSTLTGFLEWLLVRAVQAMSAADPVNPQFQTQ